MSAGVPWLPHREGGMSDEQLLSALVMLVAEVLSFEQFATLTGIPQAQLPAILSNPATQRAVDAEVLRLQHTGKLANIKAELLTNRMLDRLLNADPAEVTLDCAARLVKLGREFRLGEQEAKRKDDKPKFRVAILHDGDPEPVREDGEDMLIIHMGPRNPDDPEYRRGD